MFGLIEKELENVGITENGAVGYKTAGSHLVDINYQISSLRNETEEYIRDLFEKAYFENPKYALKWLFFARDAREGIGERRLFRICYKKLAELNEDAFIKNLINIQEFGRYDDLVNMIGINYTIDMKIIEIIKKQLNDDLQNLENGKGISLLAKWMPSENASSKNTKALAKKIRKMRHRRIDILLSLLPVIILIIMLAMVMLPLGQDLKLSLLPARFGIICHQLRNSLFGYSSVIRYLYLGREATCLSQRFTLSAAMPAMRIAAPTVISLSGLP